MVSDAGGSGSSGLSEASTSPESKSINSQALAGSVGGPSATAACVVAVVEAGAPASDFFWTAGLAVWFEAANDQEYGARPPTAIAMVRARMEGRMVCRAIEDMMTN